MNFDLEQQTGQKCILLEKKMKEKNLSQTDIAIALNITRASISRKINGWQPFKIVEVFKLIQILGISKEEIYDCFLKDYEGAVDMDTVYAALELNGSMEAPHPLRDEAYAKADAYLGKD